MGMETDVKGNMGMETDVKGNMGMEEQANTYTLH
jgi:hypothetical protein